MQAGKFVSASEISNEWQDGLFHCYGGNGLRGYTKSNNQNGLYSLIGRQGALCGNVILVDGKFYATEHAVVVTPKNSIDNLMLHHLLKYLNLNQYATGAAQPGLSVQNLEKVEVKIPKVKAEQQKIASFLSLIDERTQTQNKIIEELNVLKTAITKRVFSQEFKFKDDNGNDFPKWKAKRVGQVYSFKVTNSLSRENLISQDGDVKNIHYGDIHTKFRTLFDITREEVPYFNKGVSLEKVTEENYLKISDMIFADASEDLNDVGKSIEIVNLNNERVLSGLHTILARPHSGIFSLGFGGYLFKSPEVKIQIQREAQGSKVLSISSGRLSNVEILIPKQEEQTKITNFLSSIDTKLDIETQLLQKLEEQKKFLLRQMFV